MSRLPIIAISGKSRVGKDAAAEAFLRMGAAKYRYSFADPLRAMLKAGFGIDLDDPYWQRRKEEQLPEYGRSPREMLQTLGTEWGRHLVHRDVWVKLAADALATSGPGMVIADCRFNNEAHWVRQAGGLVVHVTRAAAPAVRAHASEMGVTIQPGDGHLANDGTIEELYEAAHDLIYGVIA